MATIKIAGTIESSVENGKVVETTYVKDAALDKTQAVINQEANAVTSMLPTEETSGKVANLVKNSSGYGVKLSDNFTVGSDGTIGVNVDTGDIDLTDYYKKTETYSQTEADAAIAAAVKAYNDSTGVELSDKIAALEEDKGDYVTDIAVTQEAAHPDFARLTIKKGYSNTQYSVDIANASTTVQGLMSASDKTKLDSVNTAEYVTDLAYDTGTRNITASNSAGTAVSTINIPLATSAKPGLMTIADKNKLDSLPTNLVDNSTGLIDSSVLPSYVDDVVEFAGIVAGITITEQQSAAAPTAIYYDSDNNAFVAYNSDSLYYSSWAKTDSIPDTSDYGTMNSSGTGITPMAGKIYVDIATNIAYRWSGSTLVAIGSSLALGETSSTAFAGNRGVALEQWKTNNAGGSFKETDTTRYLMDINEGLITAKTVDTTLNNAVANYVANSIVEDATAGIKKITVEQGAVASVEDASLNDVTAMRGDVTKNASIPLVYMGISSMSKKESTSTIGISSYVAASYYINTTNNTLEYLSAEGTNYVSDGYFIPSLKLGDILIEGSGTIWIVTKALDGTNAVQVANVTQLRTNATTVSLTQDEYDALETKDVNTIYVIKD